MKVNIEFEYEELFLPTPRSRKYRTRTATTTDEFILSEATDFKLAFEDGYDKNAPIPIYMDTDGSLWREAKERDIHAGDTGKDAFTVLKETGWVSYSCRCRPWNKDNSYDARKAEVQEELDKWRVVGQTLYERCGEPYYSVRTFGFGGNHGGTGLMTEYYGGEKQEYLPPRYYTALEGDKAVDAANAVAEGRGDTDYVGQFTPHIKVYIPQAVHLNPMKVEKKLFDDSYIDKVKEIIRKYPDKEEAARKIIKLTNEIAEYD